MNSNRSSLDIIRWPTMILAILLCIVQAMVTITAENVYNSFLTASMISVTAFGIMFLFVAVINPLIGASRLSWLRPFNRPEVLCIYITLMVTGGLSTFGMANQVIPLIPAPYNPDWNTPQRGWSESLTARHNPVLDNALFVTDPIAIRTFREGVSVSAPIQHGSILAWLEYYWNVWLAIPWREWSVPLLNWGFFFFGLLALFYALSYVVLGFWNDREKLIFPLARIGDHFLPNRKKPGNFPSIFKKPAFYFGFAVVACVLSWNAAVSAKWIVSSLRIPMGMDWASFGSMVDGSFLAPLGNNGKTQAGALSFIFSFLAIGIGFLLPIQVSGSVWGYFLLSRLLMLFGVWFGFASHYTDFEGQNAMIFSQGAGALFLFSVICLWRVIVDYHQQIRGKSAKDRMRILLPVWGMLVAQAFLITWCWSHSIPILIGIIFVGFITLVTLGLMRIVAEAGVFYYQSSFNFMNFAETFNFASFAGGENIARIVPVHSTVFVDLKAFVAPGFLTASKLQSDNIVESRLRYHLTLIACVTLSICVSLCGTLFLAHLRGAQQMYGWFYSALPQQVIEHSFSALTVASGMQMANAGWFGVGVVWLALSLLVRRKIFWFPHPIGYLLWINPLTANLWFSFFIGWFCKALVVRYGGKRTFDEVLPFFFGLIAGEIIVSFLWTIAGLAFGFNAGLLVG